MVQGRLGAELGESHRLLGVSGADGDCLIDGGEGKGPVNARSVFLQGRLGAGFLSSFLS